MRQGKLAISVAAALVGAMIGTAARSEREPASARAQARQELTISYGSDPLQQLDFHPAHDTTEPAALIVFVHGGAWRNGDRVSGAGRFKTPHFTGQGYHFASIDYRLVPGATVEQQAQDVADALAELLARADRLAIDRSRVVLMGHSAGAHLAALVGTDPRYLRGAGLAPRDIAGIVLLDGAAYDVPAQMSELGPLMARTYRTVFGTEPRRQWALSPVAHAGRPNAGAFLILHVGRDESTVQAKALEKALMASGSVPERHQFPGEGRQGHAEINRRLGDPEYAATAVVDRWLARIFS